MRSGGNYRIIKVTRGDRVHYEVQSKGFLWGWNTETYFDCCVDGLMAGDYPHEFSTIDEAETFIKEQYTKIEVCKVV
jgi:hypothetical protein